MNMTRRSGKILATAKAGAKKLNSRKYGELLLSALPRAIHTEAEYDRIAEIVTRLALIGEDNLTPEEAALLELLTLLIERYDDEHYQLPDAPPHALIQMLMEDRGLRHKDLIPVLGSRGALSVPVPEFQTGQFPRSLRLAQPPHPSHFTSAAIKLRSAT
jgi:HTH-type transcriptional regulator/antitoxin HigA